MASHAAHDDANAKHGIHIAPMKDLVLVFIGLTVLMIITIAAAQIPHEGGFWGSQIGSMASNAIALLIATIKAALVIWVFMGVRHASQIARFYVMVGFFFFGLIFIIWADYMTRQWEPVKGWEVQGPSAMPRGPLDMKNEFYSTEPVPAKP